jgi:pimeloyl-ACP methyl ester carboxylesterase
VRRVKPISARLALAFFLLLSACAREDTPRMVDAGGYRLRMLIEGRGSPAVVFIGAGFGAWLETWDKVRVQARKLTRTVAYDRGGTGKSEPAPLPRDSRHIADELHAALANAGVEPPYILVGSSLGGLHVRVFAHRYPKDVAGLILVDPTPENFLTELVKVRPALKEEIARGQKEMQERAGELPEAAALETNYQQAREAWPLPPVPVILITSTHPDSNITHDSPMLWIDLHKQFLARIPGSKHVVTSRSGHNIQGEEPELVVEAIREILGQGR